MTKTIDDNPPRRHSTRVHTPHTTRARAHAAFTNQVLGSKACNGTPCCASKALGADAKKAWWRAGWPMRLAWHARCFAAAVWRGSSGQRWGRAPQDAAAAGLSARGAPGLAQFRCGRSPGRVLLLARRRPVSPRPLSRAASPRQRREGARSSVEHKQISGPANSTVPGSEPRAPGSQAQPSRPLSATARLRLERTPLSAATPRVEAVVLVGVPSAWRQAAGRSGGRAAAGAAAAP